MNDHGNDLCQGFGVIIMVSLVSELQCEDCSSSQGCICEWSDASELQVLNIKLEIRKRDTQSFQLTQP
jgi:hypothetical protein